MSETLDAQRLGDRLKQLRTSGQLTKGQMAKIIGYNAGGSRVSQWENGRILPGLSTLQRYANHFGITVSELLRDVL